MSDCHIICSWDMRSHVQRGNEENNPYAYTGRELDAPELYYYRARYYDPQIQRFLGEDPIGFASKDTNWYRYTWNNPVNLVDSDGLSAMSSIAKGIKYCAKNPKKCRKTVCNRLNSLMHTVCDKPGLSCKGNDTYLTLQLKRARLQTCLTLRDAVTFCHGRAKDPNPAGHNRQKEQTRRRIEDCKKKLNRCDTWF